MSRRALVFHNPKAGSVLSTVQIGPVLRKLSSAGFTCDLHTVVSDISSGPPALKEYELLVVCGGDGTVHRVVPWAVEAKIPIGLIPTGTANVLARELSLPHRVDDAIEVIKDGRLRSLHLGRANGRLFHLMAGIGADGFLVERVSPSLKRLLGVTAYWLAGLTRFWSYRIRSFEVHLPKELHSATFAVISNSRCYGGQLLITPRGSVLEPCLDVCIFQAKTHLRFIQYLWAIRTGRHLMFEDVTYRKVSRAEVVGSQDIPVQLDGEPAGGLPRSLSLASETLRVFVPSG